MPPTKTTRKPAAKGGKAPSPRMTLAEVMRELEKAGSAQTKKTYLRHGACEPLFGVSFATLKALVKRIGVDHELALELWKTGNFDARNLAVKIVDPAKMTTAELDRWAKEGSLAPMCCGYVGMVAAEGPHAAAKLAQWSASKNEHDRRAGWALFNQLAARDEALPDKHFLDRLATIEKTIHEAPNAERGAMNAAVIAIGTRNATLRKAALAACKRIGKVEVDHGDTDCKTPDAASYIEKAWAYATAKGFASPAEQERSRESMRTRC